MGETRRCQATNKQGNPCRAFPLTDSNYCLAHADPAKRASVGFVANNGRNIGRPPRPPIPIARALIEENIEVILGPFFQTLGCELVVDESGAHLERTGAGAKLYGEHKGSGEIVMSDYDDVGAMMGAAEKLLDRVYGKPKQQTEVSGAGGGPVQIASTFDLERLSLADRRQLLELLERAADA